MKTAEDFHREAEVKPEDMNQTIIDTTSVPVSYFEIGNTYQYYNHKFSIWARGKWKSEMYKEKGARTVFEVTFDGKTDEKMYMDSTGIKKRIGDPRTNRNGGGESLNGGKKATGTKKVPKTPNELANQINAKYADLVTTIREKVGKIPTNAVIESALDMLCDELNKACKIRVAEVLNAAEKEYKDNIQRRDEIKHSIEINEERLAEVYAAKDYVMVSEYGKQIQGFQAELILLEQKIAAYEAAQKEGENSDEKPAALDDNGGETPAEAETSEETNED